MSKHTPGPFTHTGPRLNLKTGKPESISILAPQKENGWSTVLAEITARNVPEGEAEANAHLFAAAPEMLQVLKYAFDYLVDQKVPGTAHLRADIKAIVVKAGGA